MLTIAGSRDWRPDPGELVQGWGAQRPRSPPPGPLGRPSAPTTSGWGGSEYGGDSVANASYDEFRVYGDALEPPPRSARNTPTDPTIGTAGTAGTLQVDDDGSLGERAGHRQRVAGLQRQRQLRRLEAISGCGLLTQEGTGTVTLNGSNSITGSTAINAGGGGGLGGAVFSNQGTITLTNDTFTANTAQGGAAGGTAGAGYGGAVFARNGTLTATFDTFSVNTVSNGDGSAGQGSDVYVLADGSNGATAPAPARARQLRHVHH